MPRRTDEELLEENGWILGCESPLEISLNDDPGSRATGQAAEIVIEVLRELTPPLEDEDAEDE